MQRTIESPGVEINEIDMSLYTERDVGTSFLVNGFTSQGPYYEPIEITTISDYKTIFGEPTTPAERYAYHTVERLTNSPAKILFTKLPYDNNSCTEKYNNIYTALMYPIVYDGTISGGNPISGINQHCEATINYSDITQDDTGTFYIGRPLMFSLVEREYEQLKRGDINWDDTILHGNSYVDVFSNTDLPTSLNDAISSMHIGMIVINKVQTPLDSDLEGYYVALCDNAESDENSIRTLKNSKNNIIVGEVPIVGVDAWVDVSENKLDFDTTGGGSISEDLETTLDWDFTNKVYNDAVLIKLYKVSKSGYTPQQNTLVFTPQEYFVGSLGSTRTYTNPKGFNEESFNIEKNVKNDSVFLDIYVNTNISKVHFLSASGIPNKSLRIITEDIKGDIYPECYDNDNGEDHGEYEDEANIHSECDHAFSLGLYQENASINSDKTLGAVPSKLETALRLVEDWEAYPIDIVVDAGLSTIWTSVCALDASCSGSFDDTKPVDVKNNADTLKEYWNTIINLYDDFCSKKRKDCMFIADCYRNILVNGKDYKILSDITHTFSDYIFVPLKTFTSTIDTSYGAVYAQWIKQYDGNMNDYIWSPFSGFQGAIMANLDAKKYPWFAPAGLNDGIVDGGVDIALTTTQKQRDLLYRNNINPVVHFPNQGIATWGQKTLQKKPSAFDRINIRRLFLTLEKETRSVMKYFVFQQNSNFTRTRVVNTLTPLMDIPKNNEGILEYKIICDERNNTPDVIDNNELKVSIYIKPIRTAEYVLVDFYSTRTGQNFNELI